MKEAAPPSSLRSLGVTQCWVLCPLHTSRNWVMAFPPHFGTEDALCPNGPARVQVPLSENRGSVAARSLGARGEPLPSPETSWHCFRRRPGRALRRGLLEKEHHPQPPTAGHGWGALSRTCPSVLALRGLVSEDARCVRQPGQSAPRPLAQRGQDAWAPALQWPGWQGDCAWKTRSGGTWGGRGEYTDPERETAGEGGRDRGPGPHGGEG